MTAPANAPPSTGDEDAPGRVVVFAPAPLLTITIEAGRVGGEVHVHAGGQGVWQARMVAALGVPVTICATFGGETGRVAKALLPLVVERPVGTVLNLNVPNLDAEHSASLELVEAPLARFGIVHTTVTERDDEHVNLAIADPSARFDAGTDAALLARGAATITSIRPVVEAEEPVLGSR